MVYHLVTLFAAQAMAAVGWWQYRRNPADDWARRLSWAGVGIILTRLTMGIALAFLGANNNDRQTIGILPPVEQALYTADIILLVWAAMPAVKISARLLDAILLLGILVNAILYAFLAPNWTAVLAANPAAQFAASTQAAVLIGLQLTFLAGGILYLIFQDREEDWQLRCFALAALAATILAQAFNLFPTVAANEGSNFWLRLGHLVAISLLAIFAYRHSLTQLLREQWRSRPAAEQLVEALAKATPILAANSIDGRLIEGVKFASDFSGAHFAGIALQDSAQPEQLQLYSLAANDELAQWGLSLQAFPALQQAINKNQAIELSSGGMGARQLHELYHELGIQGAGDLLLEPMSIQKQLKGLLMLAPESGIGWRANQRGGVTALARYLAQALFNVIHAGNLTEPQPQQDDQTSETEGLAAPLTSAVDSPQLSILQGELAASQAQAAGKTVALKAAKKEINALNNQLKSARRQSAQAQAETARLNKALAAAKADAGNHEKIAGLELALIAARQEKEKAQKRAERFEEELSALEVNSMVAQMNAPYAYPGNVDERIPQLETEVRDLRSALLAAEEALAMASVGDGELNAEWVMGTFTRYAAELEEAQIRIQQLESALTQTKQVKSGELTASLAQELRTPMTSITGYTDLLLSESAGGLAFQQREMLHRVKTNTERMGAMLDQIIRAAALEQEEGGKAKFDTRETIETAVHAALPLLQEKNLRLQMNLNQKLPALAINRADLYHITLYLLNNATLASIENGSVGLKAQLDTLDQHAVNGSGRQGFLRLAISDSGGGIPSEDLGRVFEPRLGADAPLIDGVGETGIGLSTAYALVAEHGGRIWVESQAGQGSVFTTLLPIAPNGAAPEPGDE